MSIKPLRDYMARGPFDDIGTPPFALAYLIPALKRTGYHTIWESAPMKALESDPAEQPKSALADELERHGFNVLMGNQDYFHGDPGLELYDVQVTNPPFSLKEQWVERAMELDMPWALILPITALGVGRNNLNIHLSKCQVLLPPRRIDFTGKKAPWQFCAWFTYRFHLPVESSLIPVDDNGHWDEPGLDKA